MKTPLQETAIVFSVMLYLGFAYAEPLPGIDCAAAATQQEKFICGSKAALKTERALLRVVAKKVPAQSGLAAEFQAWRERRAELCKLASPEYSDSLKVRCLELETKRMLEAAKSPDRDTKLISETVEGGAK